MSEATPSPPFPPVEVTPFSTPVPGIDVGVSISGERFIYNTYEEWQETNFPFWSLKTIQRTFRHLEKMGLIVAKQAMKRHYDRKKYYQINYEKLEEL